MSSGDPYDFDDTPPPNAIRQWRRIVFDYPQVLQLQRKYANLRSVHSYDMPYLAGYSVKRDRIFFDRHMEYIQTIGNKRININPCIKLHEATESALIDCWALFRAQLHFPKEPNYEIAHHIATAVEYQAVEALDVKVKDYQKCLRPQMKEAVGEKIERVPKDYDTFPIKSEPHAKSDEQILRAVHAAMERDKGSRLGFTRRTRFAGAR